MSSFHHPSRTRDPMVECPSSGTSSEQSQVHVAYSTSVTVSLLTDGSSIFASSIFLACSVFGRLPIPSSTRCTYFSNGIFDGIIAEQYLCLLFARFCLDLVFSQSPFWFQLSSFLAFCPFFIVPNRVISTTQILVPLFS
jgi:hypothetical protein